MRKPFYEPVGSHPPRVTGHARGSIWLILVLKVPSTGTKRSRSPTLRFVVVVYQVVGIGGLILPTLNDEVFKEALCCERDLSGLSDDQLAAVHSLAMQSCLGESCKILFYCTMVLTTFCIPLI